MTLCSSAASNWENATSYPRSPALINQFSTSLSITPSLPLLRHDAIVLLPKCRIFVPFRQFRKHYSCRVRVHHRDEPWFRRKRLWIEILWNSPERVEKFVLREFTCTVNYVAGAIGVSLRNAQKLPRLILTKLICNIREPPLHVLKIEAFHLIPSQL